MVLVSVKLHLQIPQAHGKLKAVLQQKHSLNEWPVFSGVSFQRFPKDFCALPGAEHTTISLFFFPLSFYDTGCALPREMKKSCTLKWDGVISKNLHQV